MADEFRKSAEFNPQVENKVIRENFVPLENVVVKENQTVEESLDTTTRAKPEKKISEQKKNHALSTLSGGLAATIGAVAVGITSTMNVQFNAEFESVDYVDSTIVCKVNVSNMEEDNTLTLYLLEGSSVIQTANITDDDQDGKIEYTFQLDKDYLKEQFSGTGEHELRYRVDLKGVPGLDVERAFDSYVVQIDKMTSEFGSVESWCNCKVDGYFYFQMNFSDDYNLFTDFEASITDAFGNISYCTFTEDLHAPQRIPVLSLRGSSGTLKISYSSDGGSTPTTYTCAFRRSRASCPWS